MISTNTYKLVLSDAHYNAKLSVDVNVTIPPGEKKKHHYMRHYISRKDFVSSSREGRIYKMVCEKCEKKGKLGKVSDAFYALCQILQMFSSFR